MAFEWKCLICENPIISEGCGESTHWPNVDGGTFAIDCGYGSINDQQNGRFPGVHEEIQGCICDACLYAKRHLLRIVEVESQSPKWTVLDKEIAKPDEA